MFKRHPCLCLGVLVTALFFFSCVLPTGADAAVTDDAAITMGAFAQAKLRRVYAGKEPSAMLIAECARVLRLAPPSSAAPPPAYVPGGAPQKGRAGCRLCCEYPSRPMAGASLIALSMGGHAPPAA